VSTRTIVEINHDHLGELRRDSKPLQWLLAALSACDTADPEVRRLLNMHGLRVLGQRHHSEPEWVQSNGGVAPSDGGQQ
jgi:hypothetical protein